MKDKTLEELMEMCEGLNGQRFRWLKNCKTYWLAQARSQHPKSAKYTDSQLDSMSKDFKATGKTPREAVVGLLKTLSSSSL